MNSNNTHQDTPPSISKKRGKQCAVYGCHNSYYNDKGLFAGYHCNLIKRQHGKDDFNVTAATVVCSEHFRQEDIIRKLTRRYLKKAQEMDVADSSEVTEDAIIISVPPEIVSTAVSSSQCSNSLANDLDRAETSKGNVVEQLQRHIT
ncbi:unnamed protein product [Pocillopora meandrina]|uniref:THAP-type domain-containing protein n=1 Tax=Pocillopora meandrina TaxID=46732 RepID=A0AAU9XKY4_9CNID|nr:unnamed protein product [Pocillopora meandrina]